MRSRARPGRECSDQHPGKRPGDACICRIAAITNWYRGSHGNSSLWRDGKTLSLRTRRSSLRSRNPPLQGHRPKWRERSRFTLSGFPKTSWRNHLHRKIEILRKSTWPDIAQTYSRHTAESANESAGFSETLKIQYLNPCPAKAGFSHRFHHEELS